MYDTVYEKVDAIESSNLLVAFDGCHKVYLVEGEAEAEAASIEGYTLYPAKDIRRLLNKSCGLVFVNAWHLGDHPWAIEQGGMPESWYGETEEGRVNI